MSELNVLVVHHDSSFCEEISSALMKSGFVRTVNVENDGLMALKSIVDFKPDLVIAEMLMATPNGNDISTMLKHRKAYQTIPIILTHSANLDIDSLRKISAADDIATVEGGADFDGLLSSINKVLGLDHKVTEVQQNIEIKQEISTGLTLKRG